ncbi:MAG: hypothetical protein JXQ27_08160 [Acidobacteria bacterium]|nr:hypothetical protein [Acidobacteriota bacterium]
MNATPTPRHPPHDAQKKILGISRRQMFAVYLCGVLTYLICTFLLPLTHTPVWKDLTWKDVLTLVMVLLSWIGLAVYNRLHPDEEIRLNLGGNDNSPA